MRVTYEWLNEYMDLSNITPEQLAEDLTLAGLEVEQVIHPGEGLEGLIVGEVLTCDPVDNSDHLHLTKVDIGESEPLQIVCGAPNISQAKKVIVASIGTILPGDFEIKTTQIMGHKSEGMICSLDELGVPDSVIPKYAEDGIYILDEETPIGIDAREPLGLNQTIIDIELTPNRADALSVRGIAYDVAAIYGKELTFKRPEAISSDSDALENHLKIDLESDTDCLAYQMAIVKNAEVKDSPDWLQAKLMNAGIRPIDNIVDITNYVMLEYGQPLHAFDYEKINSDQILVRRAKEDETFITLDGKERKLSSENLVITNGSDPIALAGVMGGANSEITEKTHMIAVESAIFDPILTRRTAQELNLRSESSGRFEKGINRATVGEALEFAVHLMHELAGAEIIGQVANDPSQKSEDQAIKVSLDHINRVIGSEFQLKEVLEILERLRFGVTIESDQLIVSIPPRRWDIKIPEDLIEEIARIYGYNNIKPTLPVTESIPGELTETQKYIRHLRAFLEGKGLMETVNYSLTNPHEAVMFRQTNVDPVHLQRPMSEEHSTLRQNLIEGLLKTASFNQARHQEANALYEIGHIYEQNSETDFTEKQHIAGVLATPHTNDFWYGKEETVDFYDIKGIAEELLDLFAFHEEINFVVARPSDWHPGRTAEVFVGLEKIGIIGQIHPKISEAYDLTEVYGFEFSLDRMLSCPREKVLYQGIQKYPSVHRDLALVVDRSRTHREIEEVISNAGGKYLSNIHLFDIYDGQQIDDKKKSMAYALTFKSSQKTLEEEAVNQAMDHIKMKLTQELNAEIR